MEKKTLDFINEERIGLNIRAEDAESAIREAGRLLFEDGVVEEQFIDAMVNTFREFGPYIVLIPGVALPHARSEEGAKKVGCSFLQLAEPVFFGHPENDPVRLVAAVSAVDSESHISMLQALLKIISDNEIAERLVNAKDKKTVIGIFETAYLMDNVAVCAK